MPDAYSLVHILGNQHAVHDMSDNSHWLKDKLIRSERNDPRQENDGLVMVGASQTVNGDYDRAPDDFVESRLGHRRHREWMGWFVGGAGAGK